MTGLMSMIRFCAAVLWVFAMIGVSGSLSPENAAASSSPGQGQRTLALFGDDEVPDDGDVVDEEPGDGEGDEGDSEEDPSDGEGDDDDVVDEEPGDGEGDDDDVVDEEPGDGEGDEGDGEEDPGDGEGDEGDDGEDDDGEEDPGNGEGDEGEDGEDSDDIVDDGGDEIVDPVIDDGEDEVVDEEPAQPPIEEPKHDFEYPVLQFDIDRNGNGVITVDFDNDGQIDLVIVLEDGKTVAQAVG